MALSRESAARIIEAVAADGNCAKVIEMPKAPSAVPTQAAFQRMLQVTGTAGAFRNAVLMATLSEKDVRFQEKLCLEVAVRTVKAIHAALRKGNLPEVAACSGVHRVHWTVHHEATWIRMKDDTEYVFDWHATLSVRDPAISLCETWLRGGSSTNFEVFEGFK